jgi:hypothetical protein
VVVGGRAACRDGGRDWGREVLGGAGRRKTSFGLLSSLPGYCIGWWCEQLVGCLGVDQETCGIIKGYCTLALMAVAHPPIGALFVVGGWVSFE